MPQVVEPSILRCDSDSDCPGGGKCFKDECARCLCSTGMHQVDYFHNGQLTKACLISKYHILCKVLLNILTIAPWVPLQILWNTPSLDQSVVWGPSAQWAVNVTLPLRPANVFHHSCLMMISLTADPRFMENHAVKQCHVTTCWVMHV